MAAKIIALEDLRSRSDEGALQAFHENVFALCFGLFAALLLSFALLPRPPASGVDLGVDPIETIAGP